MQQDSLQIVGSLALVVVLLMAAVRVQAIRERAYPAPPAGGETLSITSGSLVRRLSVAYTGLSADLYWIRAIQYYGGTKQAFVPEFPALTPPQALVADPAVDYPLLYPLLDL